MLGTGAIAANAREVRNTLLTFRHELAQIEPEAVLPDGGCAEASRAGLIKSDR